MSMFNDIVWRTPGNEDTCMANSLIIAMYAKKYPLGCWSFLGPGCEKKWYGTQVSKPNGEWNRVRENMMINFAETGHPIFQATSPLGRGELKSKGGGKKTIHYHGGEENVELTLRTIISANQQDPDYAESEICKFLVIPTEIANAGAISRSSRSAQGNLL